MKYYLLYKTTNTKNGKIYVGRHITSHLEDGYLGSGLLLQLAIAKYGQEAFRREILQSCTSFDELVLAEAAVVDQAFVDRDDTYNIALGGFGCWTHVNAAGKNGAGFALPYGDEARKRSQDAYRARLLDDEDFAKYISALRSKIAKEYFAEHGHNWLNKRHSDETKQKMSKSHTGLHVGEKNSQYGTCWVFSDEKKCSKRIQRDELSDYLSRGWVKGRRMKFD